MKKKQKSESDSYVILDMDGTLYKKYGMAFESMGYRVKCLNLNSANISDQYNPLLYIKDKQDIEMIVTELLKNVSNTSKDTESMLLKALIGYLVEYTSTDMWTFYGVHRLLENERVIQYLFDHEKNKGTETYAIEQFGLFEKCKNQNQAILNADNHMRDFNSDCISCITADDHIKIDSLCCEKKVLFITPSESENASECLIRLLFTQIFQILNRLNLKEHPVCVVKNHDGEIMKTFMTDNAIISAREMAERYLQKLKKTKIQYNDPYEWYEIITDCEEVITWRKSMSDITRIENGLKKCRIESIKEVPFRVQLICDDSYKYMSIVEHLEKTKNCGLDIKHFPSSEKVDKYVQKIAVQITKSHKLKFEHYEYDANKQKYIDVASSDGKYVFNFLFDDFGIQTNKKEKQSVKQGILEETNCAWHSDEFASEQYEDGDDEPIVMRFDEDDQSKINERNESIAEYIDSLDQNTFLNSWLICRKITEYAMLNLEPNDAKTILISMCANETNISEKQLLCGIYGILQMMIKGTQIKSDLHNLYSLLFRYYSGNAIPLDYVIKHSSEKRQYEKEIDAVNRHKQRRDFHIEVSHLCDCVKALMNDDDNSFSDDFDKILNNFSIRNDLTKGQLKENMKQIIVTIQNTDRYKSLYTEIETIFDQHESSNPLVIKEYLDKSVIGQEEAKRSLAIAMANHLKAYELGLPAPRETMLIIGPSGSGKTFLASVLSEYSNLPIAIVDASQITADGWKGANKSDGFKRLYSCGDKHAASYGIIVLDEFDKFCSRSKTSHDTNYATKDMQSILGMLDGIPIQDTSDHLGNTEIYDTRNIMYILTGSFSEMIEAESKKASIGFGAREKQEKNIRERLKEFGLMPELIGRITNIVFTESLSTNDILRAVMDSDKSVLKQYESVLSGHNKKLRLDKDEIKKFIENNYDEEYGVRGMQNLLLEKLRILEYESFQSGEDEIVFRNEI